MSNHLIGINWGSSNFRAYRIDRAGAIVDSIEDPSGIASLGRDGMIRRVSGVAERWPDVERIYACGMIGSNIGWTDAGYVECPVALAGLADALRSTHIGHVALQIVPGLACRRMQDNAPDIMRGEETELFGLLSNNVLPASGVVALPGTHAKWVRIEDNEVQEFITAMSGEIFDRLTAAGLLASIVEGPAEVGPAFFDGVREGAKRTSGLGTQLFGARARVIRGDLRRSESASYLRGLLIGSEIADSRSIFPHMAEASIPLVGARQVVELYDAALGELGLQSHCIESRHAVGHGFLALDSLRLAQAT
jgi:2-dehydro-3-deoxygalactonokinase